MGTVAHEQDPKGRFLPGNTLSKLGGRPLGSRNKLGEAFLTDLCAEWLEHGAQVLRTIRQEDPVQFAKIVALMTAKPDSENAVPGVTVVNVITGVRG